METTSDQNTSEGLITSLLRYKVLSFGFRHEATCFAYFEALRGVQNHGIAATTFAHFCFHIFFDYLQVMWPTRIQQQEPIPAPS
mmetsp:Transcript_31571/g.75047  ORF Transcript_31571/g.75047 Transcript_31571/m.75047 type:complete len:84 (-) Transcript_31571:7-258(-)